MHKYLDLIWHPIETENRKGNLKMTTTKMFYLKTLRVKIPTDIVRIQYLNVTGQVILLRNLRNEDEK